MIPTPAAAPRTTAELTTLMGMLWESGARTITIRHGRLVMHDIPADRP